MGMYDNYIFVSTNSLIIVLLFCLLKKAGAVEQLEQKILDVSFNVKHITFITLVFDMHTCTSWNEHVE